MLKHLFRLLFPAEKRTHKWRRAQAKTMLNDFINKESTPAHIFKRIRAMDALAFEELVIEAFAARGLKVKRSKRYSGDGGVDGEFLHNGKWMLLQMKRYKSAIAPAHVRAFSKLCHQRNQRGLFVHTGRTSEPTKDLFRRDTNISVISGEQLIALLQGRSLKF